MNKLRLAAGNLDPSVLTYAANLATNGASPAHSRAITNLARVEGFLQEAASAIAQVVRYFNEQSLTIQHGTKGSWYAYDEDAARGLEFSYIFSSPTGVLLRATLKSVSPSVGDRGYEIRCLEDGSIQAFLHGKEALEFYRSGSLSRYYCVFENGISYTIKWKESGEIAEQRTRKPWSERRNPSKDIAPVATNANRMPKQ